MALNQAAANNTFRYCFIGRSWRYFSTTAPHALSSSISKYSKLRQIYQIEMRCTATESQQIDFALNLLVQRESKRQGCSKIDLCSGDGMAEFKILCVQKVSSIAGEAGEIFKRLAG